LIEIPKIPVNPVDLVGAGDAFVGGFLYGYLNEYSLKKAGMLGITCSAICIQSIGARTGIPSKEEIETFAVRKKYF
jgi:sugar/nucleoside kinase (ribokinase family)